MPAGCVLLREGGPVYQRGSVHAELCWFSGSDYRNSLIVKDENRIAGKGHAYAFKLTRTYPGSWASSQFRIFKVIDTLTHVHTAQITEYVNETETGLQMIVSIG